MSVSLKIFLTADVHLGMKFASYEDVRVELAKARHEALDRCIRCANEEACDLLVVAGDLFERTNVSRETVHSAVDSLSRFEGRAALVLPGNHDFYLGSDSNPWRDFCLQSEVYGDRIILLCDDRVYDLHHFDLPISIFPGPCRAKHSQEHGLAWMPRKDQGWLPDDDSVRIGVAHGSIEGISPDYEGRYYPMTRPELETFAVDFWLIGHTHRRYPQDNGSGNQTLFIPGIPEPDGFHCGHAGSALVIEVEDHRVVRHRHADTGTYRFVDISGDYSSISGIESDVHSYALKNILLRIIARGTLSREEHGELAGFIKDLQPKVFFLKTDFSDLGELVDMDLVNEEFTTGSFPHRLLSTLLARGDRQGAQIAYQLVQSARP